MKPVTYLALFAVLVAAVFFYRQTDPERNAFAYRDAETVLLGQALYGEYCAACHGEQLEGQPDWQSRDADGYLPAPPHDASGHTWHHPDRQLFEITKRGTAAIVGGGYQSNMPGFADDLTDEEIVSVLAFIKSTWPARIIERHDQMNAEVAASGG